MKTWFLAGCLTFGASGLVGNQAKAAFMDIATQTPEGVEFAGFGTIDTAGLTYSANGSIQSYVAATLGVLIADQSTADIYTNFTGPMNFGNGGIHLPDTQAGDVFGISAYQNFILVPHNYASGSSLSSLMTFTGATFASLGLDPGTYAYTFGSGATADSITLQIGAAGTAVPEPASLALLALPMGLAGLIVARRRRSAGEA